MSRTWGSRSLGTSGDVCLKGWSSCSPPSRLALAGLFQMARKSDRNLFLLWMDIPWQFLPGVLLLRSLRGVLVNPQRVGTLICASCQVYKYSYFD